MSQPTTPSSEREMVLDEAFDSAFCRPIARRIAKAAAPTRLQPNHITAIATVFGVTGGVLFAFPGYGPLYGALLYLTMMVVDCADGDLARLRGGGTWRGRILDGLGDMVSFIAVHVGVWLHLWFYDPTFFDYTLHPAALFVLMSAAGLSVIWGSTTLDGIKQKLKPDSLDKHIDAYRAELRGPFDHFLYWFLRNYSKTIDNASAGEQGASYRFFRRVQWVGPTHHNVGFVIAGLLTPFVPYALWVYVFVALVPANVYLFLVVRHAKGELDEEPALA
ncbi:MAG: CDP-alcohol phosphatidyltransferase family protein [Myxococcales bacterium]|nr:CDP-alcohol phosphatidyltransferase family protein [Myxococcales bacterium]